MPMRFMEKGIRIYLHIKYKNISRCQVFLLDTSLHLGYYSKGVMKKGRFLRGKDSGTRFAI